MDRARKLTGFTARVHDLGFITVNFMCDVKEGLSETEITIPFIIIVLQKDSICTFSNKFEYSQ